MYAKAGRRSWAARTWRVVLRLLPILLVSLLALCACGSPRPHRIADGVAPRERRVALLMPSFVADFCAMGGAKQLVGVSVYARDVGCAKDVPTVANFSSVDAEKIVAIHPDLVVGIPYQQRLLQALRGTGISVVTMRDDTYDDLFANIRELGTLTGREREAAALTARLRATTRALHARTRAFKRHPTVFVALGTGPIYTVGPSSYIATLIALAGGRNAVTHTGAAYAAFSAEALLRLQPDAIVTDPTVKLGAVLGQEPWRSLRAVREGHVFELPDAAILERPGPRYNEGLQWLIERLTPLAT